MTDTAWSYQNAAPRKLPVGIGVKSFEYVLRNFGSVMRIGFLPLLLVLAVYILAFVYFPPQLVTTPEGVQVMQQEWWVSLAITPVQLLASTMFVVGVHRLAVLDERPSSFFHLRFEREEVRYLLTGIILAAVFMALVAVITGFVIAVYGDQIQQLAMPGMPAELVVAYLAYVVLFLLALWPLSRIILAFPHAAVAGRIDFGVSWRAMKGNFWHMVLIFIIVSALMLVFYIIVILIIGIAAVGAALLAGAGAPTPGSLETGLSTWQTVLIFAVPATLLFLFIGFVQAVFVVMISFSYKALVLGTYEGR
jgi:hypothetical protein